mmetsp:Transcript_23544/g.45990  ORF Transcript_23544/g.45990 Transcript_23544/m.45990 type:complete len:256 (+) Transcript_23544:389-1156(+)
MASKAHMCGAPLRPRASSRRANTRVTSHFPRAARTRGRLVAFKEVSAGERELLRGDTASLLEIHRRGWGVEVHVAREPCVRASSIHGLLGGEECRRSELVRGLADGLGSEGVDLGRVLGLDEGDVELLGDVHRGRGPVVPRSRRHYLSRVLGVYDCLGEVEPKRLDERALDLSDIHSLVEALATVVHDIRSDHLDLSREDVELHLGAARGIHEVVVHRVHALTPAEVALRRQVHPCAVRRRDGVRPVALRVHVRL